MADQKIELEIVLDDGSIKKAFGTIRKEAQETEKATEELFKDFFGMGASFIVFNQGIELFNKLTSAIKGTAQQMIALSLEAEKVRVVNAQFVALTQQAGIATESFNQAIVKSIDGLIDDEEALLIANQAIIRLGQSAQRLPEIFELSRKAAAAGFNDIASNAELLTQAIQTGNTRQLRALGITLDLTKAQNEFARSLGLTAAQLTDEQRAFVNSNAILTEVEKRFGKVDASIRTTSDALSRLKVASADAFERFAIGFDRAFGGIIRGVLNTITEGLNGNGAALKANSVSAENLGLEIEKTEAKLRKFNDLLATAKTDTQFNFYNRQINETNAILDELKKRRENLVDLDNEQARRIKSFPQFQLEQKMRDENEEQAKIIYQNQINRETSLSSFRNQMVQQELTARQQAAQYQFDDDQRRMIQEQLYQQQLVMIAEQGNQQRLAIETNYSNAKGYTQEQRDALEIQRVNATNAQLIAAQEAYTYQSLSDFDKFLVSSQKTFSQIGSAAKITFVNGLGGAFAAMGQALAKGEDAMAAFGKAMLGILGDIALQMGQSFILQGIAHSLNPLTPGMGGPLIGAGVALSIFGGFLKAISGGGGATGSATAGGGGVATMNEPGGFNAAQPLAGTEMMARPSTVVNFTVQGDILDSDSTQSRIVQLLNDAIDTKGAVVRGMA